MLQYGLVFWFGFWVVVVLAVSLLFADCVCVLCVLVWFECSALLADALVGGFGKLGFGFVCVFWLGWLFYLFVGFRFNLFELDFVVCITLLSHCVVMCFCCLIDCLRFVVFCVAWFGGFCVYWCLRFVCFLF